MVQKDVAVDFDDTFIAKSFEYVCIILTRNVPHKLAAKDFTLNANVHASL